MRVPVGAVGTSALDCAVNGLAAKRGIGPIELRIGNQPDRDPTVDTPFSSHNAV